MAQSTLFPKVVQHIGEYLETDVSHLTMDSRLVSAIDGMNSLKLFEMVLYLEDCFEVEFDESIMDEIDTMRDLVNYVELLQSQKIEVT